MAHPGTVLDAVARTVESADQTPDDISTVTHEIGDSDADVPLPAVVVQTVSSIRAEEWNTDLTGYATDDSGNRIGYIYDAVFDMRLQIDVWTADGSSYDVDRLGQRVRRALYEHDAHQLDRQFADDDGALISDITHFVLDEGERMDDSTTSPDLRRYRQDAYAQFYERINTAEEYGPEDYVVTVNTPSDGSMEDGSSVDIIYDATPRSDSRSDEFA